MFTVVFYSAMQSPVVIIAWTKGEVKQLAENASKNGTMFDVFDYEDNNITDLFM